MRRTGTRPYYLATACDEIWLQPLGQVGLTGLRSETPFVRGLFDKLGLVADFAHRGEYKSAMNSLAETRMTGPQREEIEALLSSISGQLIRGIAEARKLEPDRVAALIDRAPFTSDEAQMLGLVNKIGYRDQAMSAARARADTGAKSMTFSRYLKTAGRPHASGSEIALIYGTGLITRGAATRRLTEENNFGACAIGAPWRHRATRTSVRSFSDR